MPKKWVLIIVVLATALFLRLYKINTNPPGLTPDEAALSYNAYSILKTGKDEYGTFLPIIFKSFGDYKPGLYVYLDIPFVATLGLNETSARLPSVVAGIFTVYLVYLITEELFKDKRLAFISLVVAATNPWLIYFSRGAWEVNVCLTLTLAGIYFFLKALNKNQKYFIVSAIFFALTLIDYQGAKLSTAIVLFILGILYWKQVLKLKFKYLTIAFILGLIISLPVILSLFNGQSGRLAVFSVFSYPRPADYLQAFLSEANVKKGSITYDLFYNEPLNFARGILGRFFNHFSGRFLFFEGDWANPRHTPPNQGVLVVGDIMFLAIGAIAFLKNKVQKETIFIVLWLILAPLPSILSRDQVHALRSLNLAIPFVIIITFGIYFAINNLRKVFLFLLIPIYIATYIYFLDAYFVHQPAHNSQYWEYGYKQMVSDVTAIQNNYKQVIIQQSYDQPYIYFLFYNKYNPAKWQKQAKLIQDAGADVGHVDHMDNICFCAIDWSRDRGDHGDLVVGDISVIPPLDSNDPKEFTLIDEIKYLNGQTAWRLLGVK
ncbi:MAG TPA: glycosyltransferase family 39 protein [Patescibacteria group bacterium]|nr:glycosyltransferase family 39 protein [Patescibacteria group bacterium]